MRLWLFYLIFKNASFSGPLDEMIPQSQYIIYGGKSKGGVLSFGSSSRGFSRVFCSLYLSTFSLMFGFSLISLESVFLCEICWKSIESDENAESLWSIEETAHFCGFLGEYGFSMLTLKGSMVLSLRWWYINVQWVVWQSVV